MTLMVAITASASTAGQEMTAARTSMTVPAQLVTMVLPAMTVSPHSSASVHMDAQVCCATLTMPASATHVKRDPTVTPTQSMARLSVPVPQVTLDQPVTWTLMSAPSGQILVNMVAAASTQKGLSSVNVSRDMKDLVVRWMSMNVCLILAIMMPLAWIRSEVFIASVCQDMKVCSATSTQMSVPASLVSTMANALTRSTPFTASAPKVFLVICVKWTLMNVPVHPAKMELNALMVPTNTLANVLKAIQGSTVR